MLRTHARADAFLSGPLELREGVTLVVDKGTTLFASRDPAVFETAPGLCGVVSQGGGRGCKPLINVQNVSNAGIMGDGVIDGRGGATLLGKDVTWWQLATQAAAGGHQQCFRLVVADRANNFTLYRITLKNSPNFHVVYNHGDGFTVWGLKIDTPQNARNTDGIDPGNNSKNITITHSWISTGDDDVALKAGGDGPTTNVTVAHNHFYFGHGMSIGSETNAGASKIRVTDLSLDGTKHGLRIKSNPARGGLVHDVVYSDVCMRKVDNPIEMDTSYDPADMHFAHSAADKNLPMFTDITLNNVRIEGGGKITLKGLDANHKLGIRLDGVTLDNVDNYPMKALLADVQLGPGPVNFIPAGDQVKVSGDAGKGTPQSCAEKLQPFPR